MQMGNYSIKQLEKLSGIKSHTIRIWEQRYGLLEPKRTSSNIRFYDDEQLKRLLNISILNNNGHKISKISDYSPEQMHDELLKVLEKNQSPSNEDSVNGLIVSMLELDECQFNNIVDESSSDMEFLEMLRQIIYPFLYKVGIMWGLDEISPPQEHFMSNLIRHRIITETAKLKSPKRGAEKAVLFLPENELHDIGLLLANYELRKMGYQVIYLGQTTPIEHIQDIVEVSKAKYLLTFFVKNAPTENIQSQIDLLHKQFKSCTIFIAGSEDMLGPVKLSDNITWLKSPEDLQKCLTFN